MGRRKHHLTRQQQIVTGWYLANFCGPDGRLRVFGKDQVPRLEAPAKACRERDFYEFEVNGRRTNNLYEDWLARLEDGAKSVLPKVMAREELTSWEAATWSAFVASTFIRTRKYRHQISTAITKGFGERSESRDFVRGLQYELFKAGILHSEAEVRSRIKELRTAMEDSPSFYHVLGMPRHCHTLAEAVFRRSWHTLDAPPEMSFVTSDCPVVTVERTAHGWGLGSGFAKAATIIFVPLTPAKLFVASAPHFGWKPLLTKVDVAMVNLAIIQFAHKSIYASVSSEELRRLVDWNINQVRFGDNAFLPGSTP